jgi:hypothetical protein
MGVGSPDDDSFVIDSDKGAAWRLTHPSGARTRFGSCRIPRQSLPGRALLLQHPPDGRPVRCRRLPYHHDVSIADVSIAQPPARVCRSQPPTAADRMNA